MEDLYPFGDRLLPLLSPEYSFVFNFLTFLYNHLTYYSKDFFKKIEIFCYFFRNDSRSCKTEETRYTKRARPVPQISPRPGLALRLY